jgi:beta-1,4-N-acetylglucosaminyltransferase
VLGLRARADCCFVASTGGHLAHLLPLADAVGGDRLWITFEKPDALFHLRDETVLFAYYPTNRNVRNLFRNFFVAARVLFVHRPRVIVSSGAGVAIPFFVLGRLFRVRLIFLEVFDRIDSPTVTGKICHPFAHRFLVQWPEQQAFYSKAEVVGAVL